MRVCGVQKTLVSQEVLSDKIGKLTLIPSPRPTLDMPKSVKEVDGYEKLIQQLQNPRKAVGGLVIDMDCGQKTTAQNRREQQRADEEKSVSAYIQKKIMEKKS